jgi:ATP synthase protein I
VSANRDHEPEDAMRSSIRRRRDRLSRGEESGPRSVVEHLSLIGSLGWLIVTPILIGILAGRWLDRLAGSQIFWTASLVFMGAAIGSWLAWKKVTGE